METPRALSKEEALFWLQPYTTSTLMLKEIDPDQVLMSLSMETRMLLLCRLSESSRCWENDLLVRSLISLGLVSAHDDALTRKRARHLLHHVGLVQCRQRQLLMPVLECVDNSQIHVVRQAIHRLVDIHELISGSDNDDNVFDQAFIYWLFVVWRILLRHKNLNVARLALTKLLRSSKAALLLHRLEDTDILEFLKQGLMPSLNTTRNWAKEYGVEITFKSFLDSYLKNTLDDALDNSRQDLEKEVMRSEKRFNLVLEAILSLNPLAPVPMVNLINSICLWHTTKHQAGYCIQISYLNVEALAALSLNLSHHEQPLLRLAAQQRLLAMLINSGQINLDVFSCDEDASNSRLFLMSLFTHPTRTVIKASNASIWQALLKLLNSVTPEDLSTKLVKAINKASSASAESVRLQALLLALAHEHTSSSSSSSSLVTALLTSELEHAETRVYSRDHLVLMLQLINELCLFYIPPSRFRNTRRDILYFSEDPTGSAGKDIKTLLFPILRLIAIREVFGSSKWILEALSTEDNVDTLKSLVQSYFYILEQENENDGQLLLTILEEGLQDVHNHMHLGTWAYLDAFLRVKGDNLANRLNDKRLLTMTARLKKCVLSYSNVIRETRRLSKCDQICMISKLNTYSSLVTKIAEHSEDLKITVDSWLALGLELMEKTDCTFVLPSILRLVAKVINLLENENEKLIECNFLQPFITQALQLVLGHCKKNESFWPNVTELVNIVFSDNLLSIYSHDSKLSWMESTAKELILTTSSMEGVALILAQRFLKSTKAVRKLTIVHKLLLPTLVTFGVVPRRESLLLNETKRSVCDDKGLIASSVVGSDHFSALCVRLCALRTLVSVGGDDEEGLKTTIKLLDRHVNKDDEGEEKRKAAKRYFFNSNAHLERLRLSQALLLLTKLSSELSLSLSCTILDLCLDYITTGSEQTSVRHYMEWTVIRLLNINPSLQSKIWDKLAKLDRKAMSVSSVLFILSMSSSTDKRQILSTLATWCMSQNFSTRLTAQICFSRVYKDLITVEDRKHFEFFSSTVEELLANNVLEPDRRDLFVERFDEGKVFKTDDIFVNVPKLSGLTHTEWVDFDKAKDIWKDLDIDDVSSKGSSPFEGLSYVEKKLSEEDENDEENNIDWSRQEAAGNVMLVKAVPDIGLKPSTSSFARDEDLVVVASYVDRPTNLGGLCRTCEIFGLSSLVVPDKSVVREKEFQNLAVTAQNWLDLIQVSPKEVVDFLRMKKTKGYSIVAVEQTTASVSLDSYVMPQRVVLLLGNEKEGLPVQLLNQKDLIDVFVEVPQRGHVRSLNVHVTGAILVWEYVRQKMEHRS